MKRLVLVFLLSSAVCAGLAYTSSAQEGPEQGPLPLGQGPQAWIDFYENEINKCKEYLDELSLMKNKANILFADARQRQPTFLFAGWTWSKQLDRIESQTIYTCHRIENYSEKLQEQRDKLPPDPSPTPTPDPSASPTPPAEVKPQKSVNDKRLREFNDQQVKFIRKHHDELKQIRVDVQKIAKEIADYEKQTRPGPANVNVETSQAGGLSTTTFSTPQGRILIHLPADARAGDTISGTVAAEPNGATEEERARNLAGLTTYELKFLYETYRSPKGGFTWKWPKNILEGTPAPTALPKEMAQYFRVSLPGNADSPPGETPKEPLVETVNLEIELIWPIAPEKGIRHKIPGWNDDMQDKPTAGTDPNEMKLPDMGQNGRTAKIKGKLDGNSQTTEVKVGGVPVSILAESPRSCIFRSPEQVFGPTEITIKENNVETRAPYRNIGVRLTAPKTNLMKGEQTTVTITVTGLKGIQQNIPLLLEKKGDVSMEGGDVQTIQIRPNDVVILGTESRFDVRKVVVGLRPGFFNITATVIDPRLRPIIIPLIESGGVNAYRVEKDETGFVVNVEKVKSPITGDPVDGKHKLEHRCPDLGKLPILKDIFMNKGLGKTKTECLVLITPRIIIQDEN